MNQDFRDFFALLTRHGVEFVVIGGVAYNFHAPPRATKDIDLWVRPTPENAEALIRAIREFGFPTGELDADALLSDPGRVLILGRAPNRIDVLLRPKGVHWEETRGGQIPTQYGDVEIRILSLPDLIRSKRAAGRPQDLVDAANLERIAKRRAH